MGISRKWTRSPRTKGGRRNDAGRKTRHLPHMIMTHMDEGKLVGPRATNQLSP